MIEKLTQDIVGPPVLTFYTKDPCPLCDIVMEELEPYKDRIIIEKVDITEKNNLRWLRLYRHDIPVLFLSGQFLCMHRLDKLLLERRLQAIEEKK
uniref:Glutaredoxin-like protein n=1 Tax=Streltzoviella insularis TaxID=1206366 RepID=A0A7D5YXW7_9NEOP|nr:acetyltransferase 2 [Streltzoviella insularis]